MKVCRTCGVKKNLSDFNICRTLPDGRIRYKLDCRDCIKKDWAYCLIQTISSREIRKNRKRDKNLTIKYIRSLFEKQKGKCYWLGIDLDSDGKCKLRKPSLDRLDNNKGYEVGNVVITSLFANTGRRDASISEMKSFVSNFIN